MKIADIPVDAVRRGTNWRFVSSGSESARLPMEEWSGVEPLDGVESWALGDLVIYSELVVLNTGQVVPTLCLKEALSPEYSGDLCWFVNGAWRQLGLDHVDDAEVVAGYTASPLPCDPSFDSDDDSYRTEHSANFARHVASMSAEVTLRLRPRHSPASDDAL